MSLLWLVTVTAPKNAMQIPTGLQVATLKLGLLCMLSNVVRTAYSI